MPGRVYNATVRGPGRNSGEGVALRIEPEIGGVGVVVVGDFNPAIFTPAWFVLHDLLPANVADNAQIEVIHPQITEFTADFLHLQVTNERFSAETSQAPYVRVCDLVARVFRERLPHTPLKALGINRHVHFRVRSMAERDRIGRTLAPVEPWGALGSNLELAGEQCGMTSLTMSQIDPPGRAPGGRINVTVEPSNRIDDPRLGVYVGVNDYYPIDETSPGTGERLMGVLEENFDVSLRRSEAVIDHVMSLVEEQET